MYKYVLLVKILSFIKSEKFCYRFIAAASNNLQLFYVCKNTTQYDRNVFRINAPKSAKLNIYVEKLSCL
jgi:hypothetical protein